MKNHFRKTLSLLLATIVLVSSLSAGSVAFAQQVGPVPTVYIPGQGVPLYSIAGDNRSKKIYPITYDFETNIPPFIEKLNPVFAEAYITGDYTEYCNAICDEVEPIFADIQVDKSGTVTDGSGIDWTWSRDRLTDKKKNGQYSLVDYKFLYDWRADLCATADMLAVYIKDVMAVTNAPKVNIVARCLVCNLFMAYLYEYGYEDIAKCVLYCSTIDGAAAVSKSFSGQLVLDPDGVERYAYDNLSDDLLMDFLKSAAAVLNRTYGLNLAADFVDSVYQKVKPDLVPRLLKMTFGGFASFWSMVGTDDYETARELVFEGCEEEYAGLLEKIDHYHDNIQVNAHDLLSDAKAHGVDFAVVCKYGYQLVPAVPNSDDIGDGTAELRLASLGATTSQVNNTLSDEYIEDLRALGKEKYLSPDKQVDASTCLFPDSTWIIKGIQHRVFPACIDELLADFYRFDGSMTVDSNPRFPQYLYYDDENGTMTPLNDQNKDETNWNTDGFFSVIINFFVKLGAVIREYLIPLITGKTTA